MLLKHSVDGNVTRVECVLDDLELCSPSCVIYRCQCGAVMVSLRPYQALEVKCFAVLRWTETPEQKKQPCPTPHASCGQFEKYIQQDSLLFSASTLFTCTGHKRTHRLSKITMVASKAYADPPSNLLARYPDTKTPTETSPKRCPNPEQRVILLLKSRTQVSVASQAGLLRFGFLSWILLQSC